MGAIVIPPLSRRFCVDFSKVSNLITKLLFDIIYIVMERLILWNILNLKTYIKYKSLIDSGQIITPNKELTDIVDDINKAYREKPFMRLNETHKVMLKAGKKVRITSRGSLRDIEIDGVTYDRSEQVACSIYDSYDRFFDIYHDIRKYI